MPEIFIIEKDKLAAKVPDHASLEAWFASPDSTGQARKLDRYDVIKGDRLALTFSLKLAPIGAAPKKERAIGEDKASIDAKVIEVLSVTGEPHTLAAVAKWAGIDKKSATASLQRLKKAGKVTSPRRNQWLAVKAVEAGQ